MFYLITVEVYPGEGITPTEALEYKELDFLERKKVVEWFHLTMHGHPHLCVGIFCDQGGGGFTCLSRVSLSLKSQYAAAVRSLLGMDQLIKKTGGKRNGPLFTITSRHSGRSSNRNPLLP